MPTNDTVMEVYGQPLASESSPTVSGIRYHDPLQSAVTIVHLLIILTSDTGRSTCSVGKLSRLRSGWILDCLKRVWRIIGTAQDPNTSNTTRIKCYSAFLKVLCLCLQPISQCKYEDTEILQATTLLSDFIHFILLSNSEEMDFDLETAICWSIYDFLAVGNKSRGILQIYEEHLGSLLHSEDEQRSYVESLGLDLQVGSASPNLACANMDSEHWRWPRIVLLVVEFKIQSRHLSISF